MSSKAILKDEEREREKDNYNNTNKNDNDNNSINGMTSRFKNIIHIRRTLVMKKIKSYRPDALFEEGIYGKPVNFLKFS